MPTRRSVLRMAVFVPLYSAIATEVFAQNSQNWAADYVRRVGSDIAGITGSPGSVEQRRQRLQVFIDRVVDVDAVARFCLGRFWRLASPAQQHDYLSVFHAVLMRIVLASIGDETQKQGDVHVEVQHQDVRQDGVYVPTIVRFGDSQPLPVTWVLSDDATNPHIIDVMAAGTSLRITVRNDYASFLSHHDNSIDALIEALRKQSCDTCATPVPAVPR